MGVQPCVGPPDEQGETVSDAYTVMVCPPWRRPVPLPGHSTVCAARARAHTQSHPPPTHTHTHARAHTRTHAHTHTHTHARTHARTRTYTHTQDLVHWERLPHALQPTPGGADSDGCFSGWCLVLVALVVSLLQLQARFGLQANIRVTHQGAQTATAASQVGN